MNITVRAAKCFGDCIAFVVIGNFGIESAQVENGASTLLESARTGLAHDDAHERVDQRAIRGLQKKEPPG